MKTSFPQDIKITLVDYDSGNLHSVAQALGFAQIKPIVSGKPGDILSADAVILPGVGSGNSAMQALRRKQLIEPIREFIASGRPFMGICLGLQLLMDFTSEGETECLGVVSGTVDRLPSGVKVPHMGWNQVKIRQEHKLTQGINQNSYFYFAHSYYVIPANENLVLGTTSYGVDFCSILAKDNILATQFHPEKSGSIGLKLYSNFVENVRLGRLNT